MLPGPNEAGAPVISDVYQLASGALLIRPRPGRSLKITEFAQTFEQPDGTCQVMPLDEWIGTAATMKRLGLPWSTLRRLIDSEAVTARKRSPCRWIVSVRSIEAYELARKNWRN